MQPHKKNQYGNSRKEQRTDDIKDRKWMIEWHKEHGKGFRARASRAEWLNDIDGQIITYTTPNPYRNIDNAKRNKARRIKPLHRTNEEN